MSKIRSQTYILLIYRMSSTYVLVKNTVHCRIMFFATLLGHSRKEDDIGVFLNPEFPQLSIIYGRTQMASIFLIRQ